MSEAYIIASFMNSMNSKLEAAIDESGGKVGIRQYLRENASGANKFLCPNVTLAFGERMTDARYAHITEACKEFDTDSVIVRPSVREDYDGMVGVMVTRVCRNIRYEIEQTIDEVRDLAAEKKVVDYAKCSGAGSYDPSRVTVEVAPLYETYTGVITEHPNMPGLKLVDICTPGYSQGNGENLSFDFQDNINPAAPGCDDEFDAAQAALKVSHFVRDTGLFPDTVALQYEYGFHPVTGHPLLAQIRKFADMRDANFVINGDVRTRQPRFFGVTSARDLELPIIHTQYAWDYADYERDNPKTPYCLSTEQTLSDNYGYDYPSHMKMYVSLHRALAHSQTRFIQICLQRSGVAMLGWPYFYREKPGKLRIIMDGSKYKIEY